MTAVLPRAAVTWHIAPKAASSIYDGTQQPVARLLASYSSAQESRAGGRGAGRVAGCMLFLWTLHAAGMVI